MLMGSKVMFHLITYIQWADRRRSIHPMNIGERSLKTTNQYGEMIIKNWNRIDHCIMNYQGKNVDPYSLLVKDVILFLYLKGFCFYHMRSVFGWFPTITEIFLLPSIYQNWHVSAEGEPRTHLMSECYHFKLVYVLGSSRFSHRALYIFYQLAYIEHIQWCIMVLCAFSL